MKYSKGYKYQLEEYERFWVGLFPDKDINVRFLDLSKEGRLTVYSGYAWDGPSGPTLDTKSSMRASLCHDALYQLMREGLLPPSSREIADQQFYRLCLEDGMNSIRAWWWYRQVCRWAAPAAAPSHRKEIIEAP